MKNDKKYIIKEEENKKEVSEMSKKYIYITNDESRRSNL